MGNEYFREHLDKLEEGRKLSITAITSVFIYRMLKIKRLSIKGFLLTQF